MHGVSRQGDCEAVPFRRQTLLKIQVGRLNNPLERYIKVGRKEKAVRIPFGPVTGSARFFKPHAAVVLDLGRAILLPIYSKLIPFCLWGVLTRLDQELYVNYSHKPRI